MGRGGAIDVIPIFFQTVPDNDSAYDNLLDMRNRLGWDTNIPRHGPACKKEMYKLSDFSKDEKVRTIKDDKCASKIGTIIGGEGVFYSFKILNLLHMT